MAIALPGADRAATRGISFAPVRTAEPADSLRLDAALFVGLAEPRPGPLPASDIAALAGAAGFATPATQGEHLLGRAVPISSPEHFAARFVATRDVVGSVASPDGEAPPQASTVLAAAVAAFFAAGGRDLTVVAMGAPPPAGADEATRVRALARLFGAIPADAMSATTLRSELLNVVLPDAGSVGDPTTWRSIGQIAGLPHAAYVLLPDLGELTAATPPLLPAAPIVFAEGFTLCCASPDDDVPPVPIAAPRHDDTGFALWARLVHHVGAFLSRHARTAQFVVAAPVPDPALPQAGDPQRLLERCGMQRAGQSLDLAAGGTASAFIVAAWPQVVCPASARLPGGCMGGDAILAGAIATQVRRGGDFRALSHQRVPVAAALPIWGSAQRDRLAERFCLIEPAPGGVVVGSDVTTSGDPAWRPGAVCRLLARVLREARRVGDQIAFAPSSEETWRALTSQLSSVLRALGQRGALAVGQGEPGFALRCDRSTMTQADLDAGRLRCEIVLRPAYPIRAIDIVLAGPANDLVLTSASGGSTP